MSATVDDSQHVVGGRRCDLCGSMWAYDASASRAGGVVVRKGRRVKLLRQRCEMLAEEGPETGVLEKDTGLGCRRSQGCF